ncbi:TetR family transcriptional regulator [Streptomyces sp. Ru71]|uniref:TetR/AcrR family transcriptional regulator n=1 Tax=Streptomyces sp. Ru71 TaxID=2080746 RepID=UPI000CDDFF39|nr:TetR family transcriptional regulator [Streptomyces sp. Ru71]POX50141.1 TetR family transcriptional regulator [Streptomyces sp. Ru71]
MAKNPGTSPARRASDRGRYGRLSRERVLATALELVDREGLGALSMRRLGSELGVEAMALYRYAEGKDALLEGLVEAMHLELHGRLAAAQPDTGEAPDWRSELHTFARTMYDVCLAHPHAVPLLTTRLLAVPMARRPLPVLRSHERVLALLARAGLDEKTSAAAFQAFLAWVLGYVSVELRPMVDNPDEPDPAFRLGLHRLPQQDLPTLRRIAPALAERGGPQGLAAGLDALLDRFTRPASR